MPNQYFLVSSIVNTRLPYRIGDPGHQGGTEIEILETKRKGRAPVHGLCLSNWCRVPYVPPFGTQVLGCSVLVLNLPFREIKRGRFAGRGRSDLIPLARSGLMEI